MPFTDIQREKILAVKEQINQRILSFRKTPYWNSDLPWSNLFLSGGAIASLLNGEKPNDWDWYFKDLDTMTKFQKHLVNCQLFIKDVDPKYVKAYGQDGKMITAKAITMDDDNSFITMISAPPEVIKKTFDYVHCTPHYTSGKIYISEKQYFACEQKKLIVNNPEMVKEYRKQKFINRGWSEYA